MPTWFWLALVALMTEGVASEENFIKFLPHCCSVNKKLIGKRANNLCVRANRGTHCNDGVLRYHLVICGERYMLPMTPVAGFTAAAAEIRFVRKTY